MDTAQKKERLEKRLAELQERAKKSKENISALKKQLAALERPCSSLTRAQQTQVKILYGSACMELCKTDADLAEKMKNFLDEKTKNRKYRRLLELPDIVGKKSVQTAPKIPGESSSQNPTKKSVFQGSEPVLARERIDLEVSMAEKDFAKQFGAKWDSEKRTWYAPSGVDLRPLEQWLPKSRDWSMYQLIG